jgi:3-hydroxybutyryl-CoA dehydrogenase
MTIRELIKTIGICGLGQMGTGAAVCYKRAGYRVLAWDTNEEKVARIRSSASSLEAWLDRYVGPAISQGGTIEPAGDTCIIDQQSDVVMDCIVEDMAQKVSLFRQLSDAIRRGAIFITTTSGLSITEMGRQSAAEQFLVGTHFWNPPHLMPLVEVVSGQQTPDSVLDSVCELIESIGKVPVRVNRDVPGFIGNRLLHALWREAIYLVQEGIASAEDVDRVAKLTFGLRMPALGPLENMDLVGLDLVQTIHEYLLSELAADHQPLRGLNECVDLGHLGVKSGQGFYNWQQRDVQELISRRDRQIVRQLEFLKKLDSV